MNKNNKILQITNTAIIFWIFALAELNSMHFDPQPQFWTETFIVWGILALGLINFITLPKLNIPFTTMPLTLFALYIALQPYILQNTTLFKSMNYILSSEMIICIILAIIINSLSEYIGYQKLLIILAYALFIGAMLQSLIGMAQYLDIAKRFSSLLFYDSNHPTTNIFGHFGQRNHYAHYLSWGTFALLYLYTKDKIKPIAFYPLLLWLCFALTLSASRSVFIYFGVASILSVLSLFFTRSQEVKTLAKIVLIATVSLVAIEYLYPIVHKMLHHIQNVSSGLSRIESEQGTGRRSIEWEKALIVFKEHKIWGIGWGGFAYQSVALHPLFPNAALNSGLFTNCHNILLQLMAESGIIGVGIFILGVAISIFRLLYKNICAESIFLLCLISTTLAHSMNEYPLWYMYFLAGFTTFLAFDKPIIRLNNHVVRFIGLATITIFGVLLTVNSLKFDKLVSYYDAPDDINKYHSQLIYLENVTAQDMFLQYYDYFVLDNYINVDTDYTDEFMSIESQYEYTKKFVNYHPYPDTMIKYAMLQYNLNQVSQAESMVILACNAFPVYKSSFKSTLNDPYYKNLLILIK